VPDIFVSYTSSDRDWAFWIGQELKALGHMPHIADWELSAGGDIPTWMEERLEKADLVLCVVSAVYQTKTCSNWERRAGEWAAQEQAAECCASGIRRRLPDAIPAGGFQAMRPFRLERRRRERDLPITWHPRTDRQGQHDFRARSAQNERLRRVKNWSLFRARVARRSRLPRRGLLRRNGLR
jgi:hypothetical protein